MAIMKNATVGIRELKDKASTIMDRVEDGEATTVTKHGRPVGRIISAATPPTSPPWWPTAPYGQARAPNPYRSPPSSEAPARVPRTTFPRVDAEPLSGYQRLDQVAGRRAGHGRGAERLPQCQRHPKHRDRARRGDRGPEQD